jgi:cell shape-determining protein MreC
MPWNITIVTSYWSQQSIKVMNPDGTLYVPH